MAQMNVAAAPVRTVPLSRLAREHAKFLLILSIAAIDAVWIYSAGFAFDVTSAANAAFVCFLMVAISVIYRERRPNPRIATACYETAALLSFTAVAAVLSYLVTSLNLPLIDDTLIAADALVGFNWTDYVAYVNERPVLGLMSSAVYMTTLSQVALTLIFLSLIGDIERAGRFVWAVMIGALICIAISGLLPAAGALATVKPSAAFLDANAPFVDLPYKQTFFDLRDGTLKAISLIGAKGLIAFPSYHCALSTIVVLAFWRVRWLFWPVAALNLAVLLSTPVDGGHHMIDGLAGVLVALVSWWLAAKLPTDRLTVSSRRSEAS